MSRLLAPAVLVLALILATSCYADVSKLSPKWNYSIGSSVSSLVVGDINGDNIQEIVASSDKNIFILSGDGKLEKNYSLSFTPSVIYLSDINNDSIDEILVGSGAIKTQNFSTPTFNFSDKDNIVQMPEVLYQVTKNAGDVYVIENNKAPRLFLSIDGWVRDINSADINNDGLQEYLVASGGINIQYLKKAHMEDSKPEVLYNFRVDSEADNCKKTVELVNAYTPNMTVSCAFDGSKRLLLFVISLNGTVKKTSNFSDSLDQCSDYTEVISSFSKNKSVTCQFLRMEMDSHFPGYSGSGYLEINITQPPRLPKTWVVDDIEDDSENGSLFMFSSDGKTLLNKSISGIPWYVYPASFAKNISKMLAEGSEPIKFLDISGNLTQSFKSPEENYSVKEILMDSIRGEKLNDIVAGFSGNKVSGVYVLDRDSKLFWIYKVPSQELKAMYEKDLDTDNESEIVFATEKLLYSIDKKGNLKLSYDFQRPIDKVAVGDFDGNGYMDFAVGSNGKIYDYEVDENQVKAVLAERYYKEAKDYSDLGKYDSALASINKAKSLYMQVSDNSGVNKSETLLSEINQNMGGLKKETADSLYKKGRSEFYLNNFNDSKTFLDKALGIYTQINDPAGIAKTQDALQEIISAQTPTTTTTILETTTTTMPEETNNVDVATYLPVFAGFIVLILIIIVVKMGVLSKGKKDKKPADKDVIRKS